MIYDAVIGVIVRTLKERECNANRRACHSRACVPMLSDPTCMLCPPAKRTQLKAGPHAVLYQIQTRQPQRALKTRA